MFANKKIWCISVLLLAVNLFAAENVKNVEKPSLAEEVLKAVISGKSRDMAHNDKLFMVPFEKMPEIYKKKCTPDSYCYDEEHKFAWVSPVDIDGDGTREMLALEMHSGANGATYYCVLTKINGKWVEAGNLFAVFVSLMEFNGRRGLLEDSKCGGFSRTYTFYELKNGRLVPSVIIKFDRFFEKDDCQLKMQVFDSEKSRLDYLF